MRAHAHTFITEGLSLRAATVEVDVRRGLPAFTIVGLGEAGARELRDRVRAAIINSGYDFPERRITVAVAPGDLRRVGGELDLALACALLAASGQIPAGPLERHTVFGELTLAGEVRSPHGTVAVAQATHEAGRKLIVGPARALEATLQADLEVIVAGCLSSAVRVLTGGSGDPLPQRVAPSEPRTPRVSVGLDLSDVSGQPQGVHALLVAAAGAHNLVLSGPAGSGRLMLAQRLACILPPMSHTEALEVTRIHSIAGRLPEGCELVAERPFRAPHYSISAAGLVGGGTRATAGESTLAHRGVLYLDELHEFRRGALHALRQPLDDGFVRIARGGHSSDHPTRFVLVAGVSPCPCGHFGDQHCRCSEADLARHRLRLRDLPFDRMDLTVHLKRPKPQVQFTQWPVPTTAQAREQVILARERQRTRLQQDGISANAEMSPATARRHITLSANSAQMMRDAQQIGQLSAKGVHRVLCVARTVADLDGRELVEEQDVSLALSFHSCRKLASRTHEDAQSA